MSLSSRFWDLRLDDMLFVYASYLLVVHFFCSPREQSPPTPPSCQRATGTPLLSFAPSLLRSFAPSLHCPDPSPHRPSAQETSAGSHFVEFKKLALTTATSTSCSAAWTNELAKSTIDEWFNLTEAFVPDKVRTTFDSPDRPSFEALRKLPFFPDEHGVYADMLEISSGKYIYPGCAPHQTVKYRTAACDQKHRTGHRSTVV
jgi:hypothetical protein